MSELYFPKFVDPSLNESFIRDCYIFDNYDGDTIYYHADLGYDVWATFLTGRLLDINAPEIKPLQSRAAGERAKHALMSLIQLYAFNRHLAQHHFGHRIRIKSVPADNKFLEDHKVMKKGKYGRWLVELIGVDDQGQPVNINNLMVQKGFAEPYTV